LTQSLSKLKEYASVHMLFTDKLLSIQQKLSEVYYLRSINTNVMQLPID